MYSFTLTTTNRVELLHLYETIKNGTKQFLDSYNSKNFKKDLSYDCEIASGFMNLSKQKKRLTLTKHGLNLDTQTFPFDQIISFSTISNFLPNNSKIYITLKDDKQPKEIVCSSTSDAMDVMSSFLFLSKADFNMII